MIGAPRKAEPPADIGNRLLELREASGQSQEEFAGRWKISARSYQSYERAETWPSGAFLCELALQGINVNWLLTGLGEQRTVQPLRIQKVAGRLKPGLVDESGQFRPLSSPSEDDLLRMRQDTDAMWRRLSRPGVIADIAGTDGDLAHRLADIHALNSDRPALTEDSVGPLISLVIMLDETYEAAELSISSADVGRIAAEEYRAIFDGGDSQSERKAGARAVQARHMRAAAWARRNLVKNDADRRK